MQEKTVSYAYATSPYACKVGHGTTGCYYVKSTDGPIKLFADIPGGKLAAFDYADSLLMPYSKLSFKLDRTWSRFNTNPANRYPRDIGVLPVD